MDKLGFPSLPPELALPAFLGLLALAVAQLILFFFSTRREKGKTDEALRLALPVHEQQFRETLMGQIRDLVSQNRSLAQRLADSEDDEENCRKRLRRVEHKLANAETSIIALKHKLGLPIPSPEELEAEPDLGEDPELGPVKRDRLRKIRGEDPE